MDDYSMLLALAYFKERQQNYIFSELMELLGFNRIQLANLMDKLFDKEFIAYNNNLASITQKGLVFLISRDQFDMVLQSERVLLRHINPLQAIPLDAPYVPRRFTKKFPEKNNHH